jgi:hypothetical protein
LAASHGLNHLDHVRHFPQPIRNASRHRGKDFECLVQPDEVKLIHDWDSFSSSARRRENMGRTAKLAPALPPGPEGEVKGRH